MSNEPLTYRNSGVDIDGAQRALRGVSESIKSTYNDQVVGGIGGFGSLFRPDLSGFERPLLVSSIDGVGTKTKVAAMAGVFDYLGHDIVNHCVNDILCQGAKPLFFLDYFGCAHLPEVIFEKILLGMADACRENEMALVGGETAEMPGVYLDDEFDIVGSVVGIVDQSLKLPRGKVQPGDVVIGIASNGLHTNGFTLARRALFEVGGLSVGDNLPGTETTLAEALLVPHKSYFRSLYPLIREFEGLYAMAHITGGGLYDNIPRILPSNVRIMIEKRSWTPLPIFQLIQQIGQIPDPEMYRAFNMGIGMVLLADRNQASEIVRRILESGESAAVIGEVQAGGQDVQII